MRASIRTCSRLAGQVHFYVFVSYKLKHRVNAMTPKTPGHASPTHCSYVSHATPTHVSQKCWCAFFAGELVKYRGELTAFVQVQQYALLNKPLLEAIVTMGSHSAALSDAAHTWL
jgi:creatinine amidohydrolase/Fe(II)-dependent formamide hydrolase-like protein